MLCDRRIHMKRKEIYKRQPYDHTFFMSQSVEGTKTNIFKNEWQGLRVDTKYTTVFSSK